MFDKDRFKFALENYKKDFPTWFAEEKYKWEAVKCFQDNWNIDAKNFEGMLRRALSKTYNLLASANNFSAEMIIEFTKIFPEKVREMFSQLFDERKFVFERISEFKSTSDELLKDYLKNTNSKYKNAKSHYQTENSISTYLWLKYPNKYYIYKFTEVKTMSSFLNYHYLFKKGAYKDNIKNFLLFYDDISNEFKLDKQLVEMLKNNLTEECYSDFELKTLTIDFGYYVTQNYSRLLENWRNKIEPGENILPMMKFESYTKENFLSEVFISEEKYKTVRAVLERKKNIILQGAPGVGKTFAAKRLAYSIIGEKNDNQIEFVQFHQNYSYEDFIMGYKPTENNFELKTGIFYNFCKKAESEPDKKFFFIIDEINRGNLSKIFGELLMLIEKNYRNTKIKLSANGEDFFVPENIFIIGMMNTADRSLAMIDYALRRRFSFIEMNPAFDSDGFKKYQQNLNDETFDKLIEQIKILNLEISADNALGKGFCIGHSYFCNCNVEDLRSIVEYEILPMLEEYFFDNQSKLERWENILRGVFDE